MPRFDDSQKTIRPMVFVCACTYVGALSCVQVYVKQAGGFSADRVPLCTASSWLMVVVNCTLHSALLAVVWLRVKFRDRAKGGGV